MFPTSRSVGGIAEAPHVSFDTATAPASGQLGKSTQPKPGTPREDKEGQVARMKQGQGRHRRSESFTAHHDHHHHFNANAKDSCRNHTVHLSHWQHSGMLDSCQDLYPSDDDCQLSSPGRTAASRLGQRFSMAKAVLLELLKEEVQAVPGSTGSHSGPLRAGVRVNQGQPQPLTQPHICIASGSRGRSESIGGTPHGNVSCANADNIDASQPNSSKAKFRSTSPRRCEDNPSSSSCSSWQEDENCWPGHHEESGSSSSQSSDASAAAVRSFGLARGPKPRMARNTSGIKSKARTDMEAHHGSHNADASIPSSQGDDSSSLVSAAEVSRCFAVLPSDDLADSEGEDEDLLANRRRRLRSKSGRERGCLGQEIRQPLPSCQEAEGVKDRLVHHSGTRDPTPGHSRSNTALSGASPPSYLVHPGPLEQRSTRRRHSFTTTRKEDTAAKERALASSDVNSADRASLGLGVEAYGVTLSSSENQKAQGDHCTRAPSHQQQGELLSHTTNLSCDRVPLIFSNRCPRNAAASADLKPSRVKLCSGKSFDQGALSREGGSPCSSKSRWENSRNNASGNPVMESLSPVLAVQEQDTAGNAATLKPFHQGKRALKLEYGAQDRRLIDFQFNAGAPPPYQDMHHFFSFKKSSRVEHRILERTTSFTGSGDSTINIFLSSLVSETEA